MASSRTFLRGRSAATVLLLLSVAFASSAAAAPSAPPLPPPPMTHFLSGSACGGNLTPVWFTGDTWVLYGNVTVPTPCTLTIQPGVFVKLDFRIHLYIDGRLLANGTASSPISFDVNRTNVPWAGIQFNGSKQTSYLQYANLHLVDRAIRAVRSSPYLMFDSINLATVGVQLEASSAWIGWTRINGTTLAVRANGTGSPVIVANTITNVLANSALGIYATNLDYVDVASNTVRWINATAGAGGVLPGSRGQDGGFAVGILVNGTASTIVAGNTVDQIRGGRGGNGQSNPSGNGGNGGAGGPAGGILIANSPYSRAQNNGITAIVAGHGGDGGASGSVSGVGGNGGAGGGAMGLESLFATSSGWWFYNTIQGVTGGSAGNGASGGAGTGKGARGGDSNGMFFVQTVSGNASQNTVKTLRGGYGGNGSAGGGGGDAGAISLYGVDASGMTSNNTISSLTGGTGGGGNTPPGAGGNATGIIFVGDGTPFNGTTAMNNAITTIVGGIAGVGGNPGATGGAATGLAALHVNLTTGSNLIQTVTGGQGGSVSPLNRDGQGGLANGLIAAEVPSGLSFRDVVKAITRGLPGNGGTSAAPAYGIGLYAIGNTTIPTEVLSVNGTFTGVNDFDFYLDNATVTSLNTTFLSTKLYISATSELIVENYLALKAYWPNNVTLVPGTSFTVTDNGAPIYSQVAPSGTASWIVVTNRVYLHNTAPIWNATSASASYLTYTFRNNPRSVNMTAGQTQSFYMIDTTPPTSSANPLPTWTNTRTFTIHFTYSDGFGVGVANVTLWDSFAGGPWIMYAIQVVSGSASGSGQFSFTAPSDGAFAFATTAIDKAGNKQVPTPPTANNTWTIVDTTLPGSAVAALPTWERSLTFTVTWGPAPGVTDIASYAIYYNHGAGWVTWFGDTTATSGIFNITALGIVNTQGVYAFRSMAKDRAGNVEVKAGNDTWTIVDTVPPSSSVSALPTYEARLTFAIVWSAGTGTKDISNYTIQVSDNGGAWRTWLAGVTNVTAVFTGSDGHHYGFRSLATDYAGNVESKSRNDTWTIVDITPPSSAVAGLSRYQTSGAFTIAWAPSGSTSDTASFAIQVSDTGAAWTTWFSGATNRSAVFSGVNGHTYAFRSLATDYAGNTESKSGNDTWTIVDTAHPVVVADAPEGAGVNLTPAIVITFSEPMNTASVQQAFSMQPSINGQFSWNSAGTIVTFIPQRALSASQTYSVYIDTSATDLAGNGLVSAKSFSFTTIASAPSVFGFDLGSIWPILVLLGAAAAVAVVLLMRRRQAGTAEEAAASPATSPATVPAKKSEAAIDDVFLLYRDGVLIKHETRRLRPDIDTDILSGMLTAVQAFVKDSFRTEEGELNELTFGEMHILIARGKWLILAAMITGGDVDSMTVQIKRAVEDMEDHHWDQLEEWNGDMELAKTFAPYVRKLIRGEYIAGVSKAELTRAVS